LRPAPSAEDGLDDDDDDDDELGEDGLGVGLGAAWAGPASSPVPAVLSATASASARTRSRLRRLAALAAPLRGVAVLGDCTWSSWACRFTNRGAQRCSAVLCVLLSRLSNRWSARPVL